MSGAGANLDAFWKIGGELVKVRRVTRDDFRAKLAQEAEDLSRDAAGVAKSQREAAELLPYMTDETTTLGEAVAAWREHNQPAGGVA